MIQNLYLDPPNTCTFWQDDVLIGLNQLIYYGLTENGFHYLDCFSSRNETKVSSNPG